MKNINVCLLAAVACTYSIQASANSLNNNLNFTLENNVYSLHSSSEGLHKISPLELNPINNSKSEVKLAAVCHITDVGCTNIGFGSNKNDINLDNDKLCREEGFNLTECPQGRVPNDFCLKSSSFFKNCHCDTEYYSHTDPYSCGQPSYVSSIESCNDDKGTHYRCGACYVEEGSNLMAESACKNPNIVNNNNIFQCLDDNTATKYMLKSYCSCPSNYKTCNVNNNEVGSGKTCYYSSYYEDSTAYYQSCTCPSGWSTCTYGGKIGARKCTLNGSDYWSDCKSCPEIGTFKDCPNGYICELEECSGKYYTTGCAEGYVSTNGFKTCIWGGGCLEIDAFAKLYNKYYDSNCNKITKNDCVADNSGKNFCPNGCTNAATSFGGIYSKFIGSACSINLTQLCSRCSDINCSTVTGITIPSNATCTEYDNNCKDICKSYLCDSGYTKKINSCQACSTISSITVPENGSCVGYHTDCPSVCEIFKCNSGYKNISYGEICRACSAIKSVTIPSNATCSKYDKECPSVCTEYKCNSGYEDVDSECVKCITESEVQTRLGKREYIFRTVSPKTTFCNIAWKRYLCEDKSTLIFGCDAQPSGPSIEYDNGSLTTQGAIGWIKNRYCAGANKKSQCLNNYNKVILSRDACSELYSNIYGENFSKYIGSMCSFNSNVCDWCLD